MFNTSHLVLNNAQSDVVVFSKTFFFELLYVCVYIFYNMQITKQNLLQVH